MDIRRGWKMKYADFYDRRFHFSTSRYSYSNSVNPQKGVATSE